MTTTPDENTTRGAAQDTAARSARLNIRFLRRATGISLQTLADLLADRDVTITASELSQIESGSRAVTETELAAMAAYWGATVEDMTSPGYPVFRA